MAPISWLILFFIFSATFIVFNMLNYYCFNNNKTQQMNNLSQKDTINTSLNWKW